jgi:beta-glucanase (GH16 family)
MNLAVGGRWPGDPDASTALPAAMQVDWVRVYQRP